MSNTSTEIHTRAYREGALIAEDFPLADVSDHLATADVVVWVDFCRPSHEQLLQLATELDLHELAIEDAVGPNQRPKLDHYDSHLFLASHAVRVNRETKELEQTEVDVFINSRWLVTVRKDDGFSIGQVTQRWDRSPDLLRYGVGYLLYGLLDVVVDSYFGAVEAFDEYYDEASEGVFLESPFTPAQQREWFLMRQALVRFHRTAFPMREAVSAFLRREQEVVPEALYPYYQDVYDHVLRVVDSTEALRDLVGTIVETNLSLRDYRQNLIMKKVTSWAAIIAVPTLITGYYGMNVPYPGSGEQWGAVASTVFAAMLSGGLYVVFRRSEWL
jgi:magnesium transporter